MIPPLNTPAVKGDIWQVRLIEAEFTGPFPPGGRLGKGVKAGEGVNKEIWVLVIIADSHFKIILLKQAERNSFNAPDLK